MILVSSKILHIPNDNDLFKAIVKLCMLENILAYNHVENMGCRAIMSTRCAEVMLKSISREAVGKYRPTRRLF